MTSTPFTSDVHSADDHPDVAEISALTEDLLTRERSDALVRHLADCELCADVHTSLAEIRDTLGTLPGPVRMPADIAGRIDAALAAEAVLDASSSNASAVSRETGPASREGDRHAKTEPETTKRRHAAAAVSRETASARSGAPDRPAGHPGGPSRPGRHRPARRSRRWRSAVLAGAGAVVALGIGGLVMQSLNSPSSPTTAADRDQGEQTTADGALEKHVQSMLAKQDSGTKPRDARTPDFKTKESPGNSPLAGSATAVPSCIRAGIDRTESVLAADASAPYKGGTSYLVVLPHRDDPQRVDAYVVDRSCVGGDSTGPAKVLATHTYSRR
ncbi:hypothetical protein [Streptomyces albidus (ex Kaewkla and Franco 2022)]|uniref:hypothetical protein n=1 Tax=Streptomyces albidus (ex Kaewkla and Franco 2022) TaxID=722709 RepID=UPI0015EF740D|nr:hypothetical protein [Streptomyces albidus (ex Kaewkla and Franco 2022)]